MEWNMRDCEKLIYQIDSAMANAVDEINNVKKKTSVSVVDGLITAREEFGEILTRLGVFAVRYAHDGEEFVRVYQTDVVAEEAITKDAEEVISRYANDPDVVEYVEPMRFNGMIIGVKCGNETVASWYRMYLDEF